MSTRVEVYQQTDPQCQPERRFVAILQALAASPKGKVSIGADMVFYAESEIAARISVEAWLQAEVDRLNAIKERNAAAAARRKKPVLEAA